MICRGVHCLLIDCSMQYPSCSQAVKGEAWGIRAGEDLGHAVLSALTLLEKLLVTEHEADLASIQLQMPVNNKN